jgi:endonuclease/exonuclease/phosphatase family metal-dependent hydrolase
VTQLRLASYNIHGDIGRDGWFAPARIRDVFAEIDADLLALQEVESHASGFDMLAWLGAEIGLSASATLKREGAQYGNAVLARRAPERVDPSLPGREPRGALDPDFVFARRRLRVVASHLRLRPAERRTHIRRLLAILGERQAEPAVLMGDLNEWLLWGRPLRWLRRRFARTSAPATFPPVFALDRIWADPRGMLVRVATHKGSLACIASDRLPLVATLDLSRCR